MKSRERGLLPVPAPRARIPNAIEVPASDFKGPEKNTMGTILSISRPQPATFIQ